MLASRRRRELRKILETKEKMGLTKVGTQQLMNFVAKKTPEVRRLSTAELEPSAQKVLGHLFEREFEELKAWSDARSLGQDSQTKRAEEE